MEHTSFKNIIVSGSGKMASGIVTALLKTGALVYVISPDQSLDEKLVAENISSWKLYKNINIQTGRLTYISSVDEAPAVGLVIVITAEDLHVKQQAVRALEHKLTSETIIAINTESLLLDDLQQGAQHARRIIGLNWCVPADTSAFLEIIGNEGTSSVLLNAVNAWATKTLCKDPCVVRCGYSINARLMAALAREAFYLVENGYASVADIDRACRNDAGYYLPFAGNCRYMDLMGTYAYGLVMKDLNRELSKADQPPAFFAALLEDGKQGMDEPGGFYEYTNDAAENWEEKFRKFSFEIKDIIDKYPFGYLKEEFKKANSKISLND